MNSNKLSKYILFIVVFSILFVLLYNYQIKGRDSTMVTISTGTQWQVPRTTAIVSPTRVASNTNRLAQADADYKNSYAYRLTHPLSTVDAPIAPLSPLSTIQADDGLGGGSGGAAAPVGPSQAQLDPLFASLHSLDDIYENKNTQTRDEYGRAIKGYDDQDAIDARAHDQNIFQNENTYTGNNQRALLNAANASSGLRAVLASLGGLAGSGANVLRRLVGLAANEDTGAARNTFETNASNVGTAWEQAEREQRQRREDAEATLQNNLQNNKASILTTRQGLYEKLAQLYGDELPEGQTYASKAAALAAPIAETTRAEVAPYAKASRLFSPAALQEYLAGTQNLNVNTSGGNDTPINSPIYSANRKKDQLAGVA